MEILMKIIGLSASLLCPLAFLPQTYKTIKTRQTKGLSLICYLIYFAGAVCFLIFGAYKNDLPVIICETIVIILTSLIIFTIINNQLRQKKQKDWNNANSF